MTTGATGGRPPVFLRPGKAGVDAGRSSVVERTTRKKVEEKRTVGRRGERRELRAYQFQASVAPCCGWFAAVFLGLCC
jgi:hypothetical protein